MVTTNDFGMVGCWNGLLYCWVAYCTTSGLGISNLSLSNIAGNINDKDSNNNNGEILLMSVDDGALSSPTD